MGFFLITRAIIQPLLFAELLDLIPTRRSESQAKTRETLFFPFNNLPSSARRALCKLFAASCNALILQSSATYARMQACGLVPPPPRSFLVQGRHQPRHASLVSSDLPLNGIEIEPTEKTSATYRAILRLFFSQSLPLSSGRFDEGASLFVWVLIFRQSARLSWPGIGMIAFSRRCYFGFFSYLASFPPRRRGCSHGVIC